MPPNATVGPTEPARRSLDVGDPAPEFAATLVTPEDETCEASLSELLDKPVLLSFYRNQGRVPRGLTPRVNADNRQPTAEGFRPAHRPTELEPLI